MAEKQNPQFTPISIHALFVQQKRALGLWREIVRATNRIPQSSARDEMRSFARHEFERNKGVTDLAHIRYLISTGKTEFDAMRRYIDECLGTQKEDARKEIRLIIEYCDSNHRKQRAIPIRSTVSREPYIQNEVVQI
ncbi:predicted protein [Histoplasma capsulatum H143]|uniref:LYR motif-containing protein 2 n=1 Tax=Ajellomyces capsulatus (strain H143) TaxID=544712 RepID=C6H221_AJECH|nr:predicted protein [Histoplasma capsulatum H143]